MHSVRDALADSTDSTGICMVGPINVRQTSSYASSQRGQVTAIVAAIVAAIVDVLVGAIVVWVGLVVAAIVWVGSARRSRAITP